MPIRPKHHSCSDSTHPARQESAIIWFEVLLDYVLYFLEQAGKKNLCFFEIWKPERVEPARSSVTADSVYPYSPGPPRPWWAGGTNTNCLKDALIIINPLTSRPGCMPGSRYTGGGVLFFVHLKLELLTQFPASNDEKYINVVYIWRKFVSFYGYVHWRMTTEISVMYGSEKVKASRGLSSCSKA